MRKKERSAAIRIPMLADFLRKGNTVQKQSTQDKEIKHDLVMVTESVAKAQVPFI